MTSQHVESNFLTTNPGWNVSFGAKDRPRQRQASATSSTLPTSSPRFKAFPVRQPSCMRLRKIPTPLDLVELRGLWASRLSVVNHPPPTCVAWQGLVTLPYRIRSQIRDQLRYAILNTAATPISVRAQEPRQPRLSPRTRFASALATAQNECTKAATRGAAWSIF